MREFKVGDKVWEAYHGHGVVTEIDDQTYDSVVVSFPDGNHAYFPDGRYMDSDKRPRLFHADEIPGQCEQTLTAEATMSRRDEFAIRIACAHIMNDASYHTFKACAEDSVAMADALIAELDRTSQEEAK